MTRSQTERQSPARRVRRDPAQNPVRSMVRAMLARPWALPGLPGLTGHSSATQIPQISHEDNQISEIQKTLVVLSEKIDTLARVQASQQREMNQQSHEQERQSGEIEGLKKLLYNLQAKGLAGFSSHGGHGHPGSSAARERDGAAPSWGHHPGDIQTARVTHSQSLQDVKGVAARGVTAGNVHPSAEFEFPSPASHSQQPQASRGGYLPHSLTQSQASGKDGGHRGQPSSASAGHHHHHHHQSGSARSGSVSELYSSARSRASTTGTSHSSSTSPQSPFHALASASGVILPEYEVREGRGSLAVSTSDGSETDGTHRPPLQRSGQPNYRQLLQDQAAVDYQVGYSGEAVCSVTLWDGFADDRFLPLFLQSIVRLILERNDQQASIFLQQKLKSCSDPVRRAHIIDSLLPQAFDLITNRFVVRSGRVLTVAGFTDNVSLATPSPAASGTSVSLPPRHPLKVGVAADRPSLSALAGSQSCRDALT